MKRTYDQISQEEFNDANADTQPMMLDDDHANVATSSGTTTSNSYQKSSSDHQETMKEELDVFIKQLIASKNSNEIKTVLPALITYLSPSSSNFIPNALSFITSSTNLLEHLISVFTYILNELDIQLNSLYDRDTIVLFIRFSSVMVCSNIDNHRVVNFMSRINYWSDLLSYDSHKIKKQIFNGLVDISMKSDSLAALIFDKISHHEHMLLDWDQGIRKSYLKLLSVSCPFDNDNLEDGKISKVLQMIRKAFNDRDARVRTQAVESLVLLSRRGLKLSFDLYPEAVNSLHDDVEEVREQGLELVTLIAKLYPNRVVSHSGTQLSLVEDAFGKICNAVRDHVVPVRTKACKMLGKLKGVSEKLLLEGFGKIELEYTPKYNRKRQREEEDANTKKKALQQRQMIMEQTFSSDDFADQEGDGDVSIKGTEKDALLYSGAIGTFVLALEDQYRSVRMAIIESICELNNESELFSRKSVDYLIEMFNDEIDSVRIHAIDSVSKISASSLIFDEEQLQIVLAILEDSNSDIRASIRNLLSVIVLSNARCLNAAIRGLLVNNLRKYRSDLDHIYKCLRDIAKNHSKITEFLIEELLRLERYIMPTEYKVDDEYYTGLCIVIFNASEMNPKIPNHLPKYMFKHYAYLRTKHPNLFPDLNIRTLNMQSSSLAYTFSNGRSKHSSCSTTTSNDHLTLVLPFIDTFNQIRTLSMTNEKEDTLEAMKSLRNELQKTAKSNDRNLNVFIQFLKLYCTCCHYYLSIRNISQTEKVGPKVFQNIIQTTYKIETLFGNLSNNLILQLMCLRFIVYVKYLIYSSEKGASFSIEHVNTRKIRQLCQLIQESSEKFNLPIDDSLTSIILHFLSSSDEISTSELQSSSHFFPKLEESDIHSMTYKSCQIISPVPNLEKPIEFQPFVSLPLSVQVKIRDLDPNSDKLFIDVSFSDGTHSIFPVNNSLEVSNLGTNSMVSSNNNKFLISKEIQLRTEWWSESCPIEISLSTSYTTQIPDEYNLLSNDEHSTNEQTTMNSGSSMSSCLVPIGRPIQLLIHPKLK